MRGLGGGGWWEWGGCSEGAPAYPQPGSGRAKPPGLVSLKTLRIEIVRLHLGASAKLMLRTSLLWALWSLSWSEAIRPRVSGLTLEMRLCVAGHRPPGPHGGAPAGDDT